MDKLSREYIQGYTAAIRDIISTFDSMQSDLKEHGRMRNYKTYKALFEFILENRAALREHPNSFVRCNNKVKGGFEIYTEMI